MATFITRFGSGAAVPDGATRVAVKDLMDMAGSMTTNGSRIQAPGAAAMAGADAACLAGTRAAEAAGRAVIVGKTNMHELAFGITGVNPWFGTPPNPLDPALAPGGSSSGSAVAVAAGEADVAFGSDTGGSIRIPAACCGIVGLKTTRGRIDLRGVRPLAPSLDTVGPLAATVAGVIAGMELLEPGFAIPAATLPTRLGRFRPSADPVIDEAVDWALGAYASATGARVVEIDLPGWAEATHAAMTILSAEAWAVHAGLWKAYRGELSPDVAERLELAAMLDAEEVAAAWEVARAWAGQLGRALSEVEAVALPTLAAAPPRLDDPGAMSRIRHTAPVNLAGLPALSLPVRVGGPAAGAVRVPPSLQLIGPAGTEEALLAAGAVLEKEAGWPRRPT